MKVAAQLPELLILIFENLSSIDLSAASQVCQTWHHTALYTQGRFYFISFGKLVDLLDFSLRPPLPERYSIRTIPKVYYETQEHVTEPKWKRFIQLSGYVQKLTVKYEWSNKSLMVALSNLMSKHGGHPFPNLRFISFWSISFEEGHMFPMCCFSSNLRSVVASNAVQDSEGRNYNYLFEVLKNHCPDIEELALPQQIMPVNIASLSFFQGLKCLKYDGQLSPYILMSIAQCNTLRSLSLTSSYLPGPMAVKQSPSNAVMELEALLWLASSAKRTMPNLEEIDLGVVSFNTDSATTTLLRSKLLFPSLKRVYLTDWGHHSLPWLEQLLEGNPSITQVRITIRTILHLPLIDCLLRYRNVRRIHLSESGPRIDGSPGDHLHSWLASMPWLEAFEWTVADHTYTARLLGIPNLTTLSQLIFGHPRLQELAMPFDPYQPPTKTKSSLFSLGKSIIKSNPPRLDDHRHQSSTSLRSLQLFLFNNRLEDVPKTFKALVDIVPEQVELTILVTPMRKSQLFMDAECERSIAAEAQFRRLLETDRREKQ